eukprot:14767498-Heterocapsa_arctica.AAC.1
MVLPDSACSVSWEPIPACGPRPCPAAKASRMGVPVREKALGSFGPLVATGTNHRLESRIPGSSPCAAGISLRCIKTICGATDGGNALAFARLACR